MGLYSRVSVYPLTAFLLLFFGIIVAAGCGGNSGGTNPEAPPEVGTLYIQSSPIGASISINGGFVGRTAREIPPWSLNAGDHIVQLELLGYQDTTLVTHVTSGSVDTLAVALSAQPGTPRSFGVWASLDGYPVGLAASRAAGGPIYVATHDVNTVTIFSQSGSRLGIVVANHSDYFASPAAMSSGDFYCGQYLSGFGWALQKYSSTGRYLSTITPLSGSFSYRLTPAVAPNDSLFVLSQGGTPVQVFKFYHDHWSGVWNLERNWISDMAIDPVGKLAYFSTVAGSYTDSLLVYTTSRQRVGGWRLHLYGARTTVAPDGTIYVGGRDDVNYWVIRHFASSGAMLAEWKVEQEIAGIAADDSGRVYVGMGNASGNWITRYTP